MQDRLTLIYEFINRGGQEAERAKRQIEAIGQAAERATSQLGKAQQINARLATGARTLTSGGTAFAGGTQFRGGTAFVGTTQLAQVNAAATRVAAGLNAVQQQAIQTGQVASQSLGAMNATLGKGALAVGALVVAFKAYRHLIQETILDTTRLAARNETLAVVTTALARANNLSRDSVFGVAEAIKRQGITTQVSLDTVNKLIFAQLDLAKASDLARLAQDAAVIAGENSSQTLDRLIFGITTRQTEVLRRAGINVLFEPEFARRARELGRELTEVQKNQIAYNLAVAQGAKITGTYEASLVTAEKRLGSLARFVEEAQAAIGEHYIPAFSRAIDLATSLAQATEKNAAAFALLGRATAGISLGAGVALFLRLAGAGSAAGLAGAVVGGAAFALSDVDPVEETTRQYKNTVGGIVKRREAILREFEQRAAGSKEPFRDPQSGLETTPDVLQTQLKSLDAHLKALKSDAVRDLLDAAKLRLEQIEADAPLDPFGLLGGKRRARLERAQIDGPQVELPEVTDFGAFLVARVEAQAEDLRQKTEPLGPRAGEKLVSDLVAQNEKDQIESQRRVERLQQLQKSREKLLDLEQRLFVDLAGDEALPKLLSEQVIRRRGLLLDANASQRLQVIEEIEQQLTFSQEMDKLIEESRKLFDKAARQFSGPQVALDIPELAQGIQRLDKAWQDRLDENRQARERLADSQVRAIEDRLRAQERILTLSAGPGQEFSAIQAIERLRIDAANRIFDITRDQFRLEREMAQARRDSEIQVLELRRQEQEEFVQNVQQAFDAIATRGSTGFREFLQAQIQGVQRTVVGNIAREVFEQSRDQFKVLQLPGQQQNGELTLLGRLLRGTPFGIDPEQLATNLNTRATELNTVAQLELGRAMLSLSGALSGASGGSAGGTLGGGVIGGGFGVAQGVAGLFNRPDSSGDLFSRIDQPWSPEIQAIIDRSAKRGSLQTIGTIGALAGAGFGVVSGIRQGGAQGTTTAIASGLGAASLIPGPQAPFLAAGALITGFVGSLLGGRTSEEHNRQVSEQLDRNRFAAGTPLERELDISGREVDFDRTGQPRPIIIQDRRTFNISAIDARSLQERGPEFLDAIMPGIQAGHPVVSELREQYLGR